MKPIFPLLLPLALVTSAQAFDLVRSGRAACTLVVAERPTPSARLAALELRHHLFKMTGVEVPVRSDQESVSGARVLVGESDATRALGIRGSDFASQEYLVSIRSNVVILIGRDWADTEANRKVQGFGTSAGTLSETRHKVDYGRAVGRPELKTGEIELPGLYDDQGTCLAAYDFLERHGGVRWYGPAETGVVIPEQATVSVAEGELKRSLGLKHRSALPAGNWPFLRKQWGEFTQEQVHLLWRRQRQGGERWAGNHTFYRETIKASFTNAEYQCQNPKGLGSQLCYTNPRLIEQVAGMARDFFDGKGTLSTGWRAMGDYFAMVPDDNMNLCGCDACQSLLKGRESRKSGQFSSGEMSDYWFTFVNAVAREVRKTHPDKFIATLAYWAYSVPPAFPLEPNVSVAPCLQTCYFPICESVRTHELKWYQAWRSKASAPMYLWVYYHHPMEPALIDGWKCFPQVTVHRTAAMMRTFIRDGVRGIFECGEQDQLEQYVMSKVWDDPEANVDALVVEFFRLYFGTAAEPMKRFYLKLESVATDSSNFPPPYSRFGGVDWRKVAWEKLGTAERMTELEQWIDDAGRRASTDLEKKRVGQWRAAFWDWMREGREQYVAKSREKTPGQ
ncbi:MAG: DUF4838 domain-containing protein [Verrucomicrobiales bacterium]|nr:DUF4838 domain-containing protein [Verrucomicrobiales bacterium]